MPSGANPIPFHVTNSRQTDISVQDRVDDCLISPAAATVAAIEARPEDAADLLETEKNNVGSFRDYRRKVAEMIRWWKENYPELHDEIVFELPDADRNNPTLHYYGATHDLRYNLLDPKWVKIFLSGGKKWKNKEKTVQYSFDTPRKYHDAILKCSGVSKYKLPQTYRLAMKAFLDNLKIEKTKAKGKSQLDENEADPIGFGLYEQLCKWAVESGTLVGIFVWAFMTTQWNIMGRTVNVDPLGFHNMRKSQHDSIIFQYDSNKMDKKGEKVSPKNCYANPKRPFVCIFLAIGCYLSIFQNRFKRASDKLFHSTGKDGSASNSFSKALKNIINSGRKNETKQNEERERIVREHCRDGHFHPHGIRKGSGTHVTTCTMDPPPIPSVLMRGEWSLGKVLDVYWKFSMIGDTYLGRCLAGFNPDQPGFGMLPPHFSEGTENKYVMEGMRLCFGGIIDSFEGSGIEGCLLLFLASIVYHADTFLLPQIANNPSHPFMSIPILSKPEILKQLQKLVTLEPSGDVKQATGVPRHAQLMDELREVYQILQGYVSEVRELKVTLPDIVKNAIEDKATESGHVTATYVLDHLNVAIEKVTAGMEEAITAAVEKAAPRLGLSSSGGMALDVSSRPVVDSREGGARGATLYQSYKYHDEYGKGRNKHRTDWDVPADFDFPTADLYVAWTAWLLGYPLNRSKKASGEVYSAPVRPLHLLRHGHLPAKAKKKFDNAWRPILQQMHNAVASSISNTPVENMHDSFIRSNYEHALKKVCIKYNDFASAFNSGNRAVSTCSKALKLGLAKKRKGTQISM